MLEQQQAIEGLEKALYWVRRNYEIDFGEGNHWHDCLDDNETPISDRELAELYFKEFPHHTSSLSKAPTKVSDTEIEQMCTAKGCKEKAVGDYSGHGDYACAYHMRKWNDEFDEEYS